VSAAVSRRTRDPS